MIQTLGTVDWAVLSSSVDWDKYNIIFCAQLADVSLSENDISISEYKLLYYFSIFGLLKQWEFAQNYKIFAKVASQFCQIITQEMPKSLLNFCLSGENAKSGHTGHKQNLEYLSQATQAKIK